MTERVTASVLTEGARVLVARGADGAIRLPEEVEPTEVAEVREIVKAGRKRRIVTDLGEIEAGPTAKILLALDAPEPAKRNGDYVAHDVPAPTPPTAPDGLTEAAVTLDAAGRVTPESAVTVGALSAPVPARDEHLPTAPARLAAALSSIGFEPVTSWALTNGAATCKVRPNRP